MLLSAVAREEEYLLYNVAAALAGPTDAPGEVTLAGIGRRIIFQEFCEALDDAQEVIEVMSDPARERPHGFHLLRMPEPFFQKSLFRKVP